MKDQRSYRISSIDFLRGLVLVIMVIDHSRDFFLAGTVQDPMKSANPDLAIFITRWITHFCAPAFVLLAGVSVGLMGYRKPVSKVSTFVLKRGVWLIIVEVVIMSFLFTFWNSNINGGYLIPFQVIWAIGASMVVLSVVLRLGYKSNLIIGALIILLHNMLDYVWPMAEATNNPLWIGLYRQSLSTIGSFNLMFAYPLIPWIGIMLFGYGIAPVFKMTSKKRKHLLLGGGTSFIVVFLILRSMDIYGDPNPWELQESGSIATILDFLNISKYPPSLLFFLITMGPMLILSVFAENFKGWWNDTIIMFGRVPFFFYIMHFLLIHVFSIFYGVFQGFEASQFYTVFFMYPEGYGTGLPGVYIVWIIVLIILYPMCKWMSRLKMTRKDWWLSYL